MQNPLINIPYFKNINIDTLDSLYKNGNIIKVKKRTILLHAKHEDEPIYFLMKGCCFSYNITSAGKRKILFIFKEGNLLNESIIYPSHDNTFCEVKENSVVFKIPRSIFIEYLNKDFELNKEIMHILEERIWRLSHQLKNTTGALTMEHKLASKLYKLARDFGIENEFGIEINLNLPITFLADMLGITREATSRVCKVLVDKGLIIMNGKRIIVHPKELKAFYYNANKKDI